MITMLISMSKLMSGFVLCVSDDASVHVCIHERTSNSTVTEEGARGMRRRGEGGGGGGRGATELCGWLNFYFPKQVLKGGQTVCFATNLSWRNSSNLRVLVAMVKYDMSADCDGEVTRGSLPCIVPELPRVVKRVMPVPGPSMIRQRIVKTHDLFETRSTLSIRPFGCCLPTRAKHVICLNVGPTFPNHEEWSRNSASSWVRVFIGVPRSRGPTEATRGSCWRGGWKCERAVPELIRWDR